MVLTFDDQPIGRDELADSGVEEMVIVGPRQPR